MLFKLKAQPIKLSQVLGSKLTFFDDAIVFQYPSSDHEIMILLRRQVPQSDMVFAGRENGLVMYHLKITSNTKSFVEMLISNREKYRLIIENDYFLKSDVNYWQRRILIQGNRCKIVWGDLLRHVRMQAILKLRSVMSYSVEAYSRKSGAYPKTFSVFDEDTDSFPVGLLHKAIDVFKEMNVDVTIVDRRKRISAPIQLQYKGPKLYHYQVRAAARFLENEIGTIQIPTGGGKTVVALYLMTKVGQRTLVIMHKKELLYQWFKQVVTNLNVTPKEIFLLGDSSGLKHVLQRYAMDDRPATEISQVLYEPERYKVGIVMIQSLTSRLNNDPERTVNFLNLFNFVIVDEAHHVPAETMKNALMRMHARWRLGLSATPWRTGTDDIIREGQVGPVIYIIEPNVLVKDGFIARPRFFLSDWDFNGDISRDLYLNNGHYRWPFELKNYISSPARCQAIAAHAAKLFDDGHRVFVDVNLIKMGKQVEKYLRDAGYPVKFLMGKHKTGERQQVLNEFNRSSYRFILVSTLLGEGVDIPNMTAIIIGRGGKSSIALIQAIGRALRPKPDDNTAVIVNLIDKGRYSRHHSREREEALSTYYGDLFNPEHVTPPYKILERGYNK